MTSTPKVFWILRFSSLGDIIVTTAALSWLKDQFPESKIYYVTSREYQDLFTADPRITEVITLDRQQDSGGSFIRFLRQFLSQFLYGTLFPRMRAEGGVILDFHNSLRAKLLKLLAPLPTLMTIQKHSLKRRLLCLTKINLLKNTLPLAQRLCQQLATAFDVHTSAPTVWRPQLYPSTKPLSTLQHKLPSDHPFIAIVPVAHWAGKRWPVTHFATLIRTIHQKTNYRCLILGTAQDASAHDLAQTTDALSLVGRLSLRETLPMLKQFCKMVIANDTGLMHIADALDIPTCAILGPTHISLGYPPLGPSSFVAQQQLWCRPCSRTGQAPCIRWGKRPCLTTLTPQTVFSACVQHWGWSCLS